MNNTTNSICSYNRGLQSPPAAGADSERTSKELDDCGINEYHEQFMSKKKLGGDTERK